MINPLPFCYSIADLDDQQCYSAVYTQIKFHWRYESKTVELIHERCVIGRWTPEEFNSDVAPWIEFLDGVLWLHIEKIKLLEN